MDATLALLATWMPRQRWFTHTDGPPTLRVLDASDLPHASDDARVTRLIVAARAPGGDVVYQVPLVERAAAGIPRSSLIGTTPDGRDVFDGPQDVAFTAALGAALGRPDLDAPAQVLAGEQSNTSIIYRPGGTAPVIAKVFRRLSPGLNPDIELQSALAVAGSPHVPPVVGDLAGSWTDPADASRTLSGSLAFAQEFLPDVEDAWRVALRAAEAGHDFSAAAQQLGRATADVHLDLARLFPTAVADAERRRTIAEAWERRLAIALDEVPPIRPHAAAIRARYAAATGAEWPALQRIHGDYHLGQVLHVPGRGWVLLDFEGEPMRPMHERRAPDLAARDVAGMLRSFDYVAGAVVVSPHDDEGAPTRGAVADAWAGAARAAFLAGYRSCGPDAPASLLDALELDKAVYEAIYETRHRPDWLSIPLAAITRLVSR